MVDNILQFSMGAVLLYFGAEFLITGSKSIAEKFNIPPVILGITLVAFGTSLPELLVSISAILSGDPGIVVGNVVGSNIANIGLVLGITSIMIPIYFAYTNIRFDLSFLMFTTILPMFFIFFGNLVFWQGLIFLLLLFGYCLRLYQKNNIIDEEQGVKSNHGIFFISLKIIMGTVGLGLGAQIFVLGAKGIAIILGVSSLVIGMSIVALGTSLPELATSIAAARHNQTGFVIGNIIGSNIMNIIAVLGFTLLISPITIEFNQMVTQGTFMVILTIALFGLMKFKGGISKFSAGILLFIYMLFLYFNFQFGLESWM